MMIEDSKFNVEEMKIDIVKYFHIGIPGLTNQIQNETMVLFAGRPAIGKTQFLTRIAKGACINNLKVAYFSLGTSKRQIMKFMAGHALGYSVEQIITSVISEEQDPFSSNANSIYEEFKGSPYEHVFNQCYIFDKIYSSTEIYNVILDLDRKLKGLDVVIIDDLFELTDYSKETVEKILSRFKYCSSFLNIRFIFSTNVDRRCEHRNDKRPDVYDVKDFENMHRQFQKIICLYREKYYNPKAKVDSLELIVFANCCNEYEEVITIETMF